MSLKAEYKKLILIVAVFSACFYLPAGRPRFDNAVIESLKLLKWYARQHVLLCLIPAFFIARAISVFISQASVMKYLGPKADKLLAYSIASISGTILATCSCTILPLFAGVHKMGAGLGPACTFLYSGPAINVLAIILTARILGLKLGIARAVGAIVFSVVIGLLMHLIYNRQQLDTTENRQAFTEHAKQEQLWQNIIYFASMVGILVFANLSRPSHPAGPYHAIYSVRWPITAVCAVVLTVVLWFRRHQLTQWLESSWLFAWQILPLLFLGILAAGLLLGRPGHEGLIPSKWIVQAVGGNSIRANLFASVAGALMYFATLTEVPILQGLIGAGMGKGPALALLLAGPALSLPNMLVIRSIIGTKKTLTFVLLVIIMATISGIIFGTL